MKDHLRENEMDGIGNMCEVRAIGFAKFLYWFETAIGDWDDEEEEFATDYIFVNEKGYKLQFTIEEMYKEYLKTLENDR